jgi:hypothetical protein
MLLSIDVGIKNLALCVLTDQGSIEYWSLITCKEPTPKGVCEALGSLDSSAVTDVVIERQPNRNQRMKCMEAYIHMYFVMSGKRVSLISPIQKLRYAESSPYWPGLENSELSNLPNTYYNRKKMSVETIKTYLANTSQPLANVFNASKKKDDLADAALQGLAFLAK